MVNFYIKTLGCKANLFDSNSIANELIQKGWQIQKTFQNADVIILNSCCVTKKAESEAKYLVRFYKKHNPHAFVVFCGCYAQIAADELAKNPHINLVLKNEQKINDAFSSHIIDSYNTFKNENLHTINTTQSDYINTKISRVFPNEPLNTNNKLYQFKPSQVFFGSSLSPFRTRAFIKIQDGCDAFCSYCIIPYTRGKSKSVDPHTILEEINKVIENGTKEIVLTGIHIGYYGKDLPPLNSQQPSLKTLLINIFESINYNYRIRLSSLEPNEIDDELLQILQHYKHKFCDHFHIPLQSGSNKILHLMNRHYTSEYYQVVIEKIKKYFPLANIGTDVIVGFPEELEDDFVQTYNLIKQLNLGYVHVFPYSERPGTPASKIKNTNSTSTIKQRVQTLIQLSNQLLKEYAQKFISQEVEILWEEKLDKNKQQGTTRNYLNAIRHDPISAGIITKEKVKNIMFNNQDAFLIV